MVSRRRTTNLSELCRWSEVKKNDAAEQPVAEGFCRHRLSYVYVLVNALDAVSQPFGQARL